LSCDAGPAAFAAAPTATAATPTSPAPALDRVRRSHPPCVRSPAWRRPWRTIRRPSLWSAPPMRRLSPSRPHPSSSPTSHRHRQYAPRARRQHPLATLCCLLPRHRPCRCRCQCPCQRQRQQRHPTHRQTNRKTPPLRHRLACHPSCRPQLAPLPPQRPPLLWGRRRCRRQGPAAPRAPAGAAWTAKSPPSRARSRPRWRTSSRVLAARASRLPPAATHLAGSAAVAPSKCPHRWACHRVAGTGMAGA